MAAQETLVYQLWVVGILMLFFSKYTERQIALGSGNVQTADNMYGSGLTSFIGIASIKDYGGGGRF